MITAPRQGFAFITLALVLLLHAPAMSAAQQEVVTAPYVPTSMEIVNTMLRIAGVSSDDVLYDLGSGDGRIPITAASRFGARAIGFEIIPWLVEESYRNADSAGVRHLVDFEARDLFEADYSDATVVTLYLGAEFNLRLRPILLEKLRPGTRLVSHAFHMREWEPDSTVTIGSGAGRATVFLWIVPAAVDGFWRLQIEGEEPSSLELTQRFQMLSGAARRGDREARLSEGRLIGERIEFALEDTVAGRAATLRFSGRLQDGRLSGTVTGPPSYGTRRWTALRFTDPDLAPPASR